MALLGLFGSHLFEARPIKDIAVFIHASPDWLPVCVLWIDKVLVGSNLPFALQVRYFDGLALPFGHLRKHIALNWNHFV